MIASDAFKLFFELSDMTARHKMSAADKFRLNVKIGKLRPIAELFEKQRDALIDKYEMTEEKSKEKNLKPFNEEMKKLSDEVCDDIVITYKDWQLLNDDVPCNYPVMFSLITDGPTD